jgi:transposase InsO family protein
MCAFFGVSRSGYYDFLKRTDKPDQDEPLVKMISECQDRCGKTYGYRRVHIWLERNGVHRNRKTIHRIMFKYGLLSEIRRRKKYKRMSNQIHTYENKLNRDFKADSPNIKWVTDISYIHTAQGVLYLSAIRDLYDLSIVAYKTGTEQTVNLVLNTIKTAYEKETVATELQLHSDQGFQYTSHGYFNLTKQYGISPSMSRRGNCYDNAMAENFFSILKSECINRRKIATIDEARSLIDEYIYFYNNERIQLKTKLTPLEKRRQSV